MRTKVQLLLILAAGLLLQGCSAKNNQAHSKPNPLEDNPDYVCVLGDCRRHGK